MTVYVYQSANYQRSNYERGMPYLRMLSSTVAQDDPEYFMGVMGTMLVAEVDTDDLEQAFQLTNHIDRRWWNNPGVTTYRETRSTSVGDILRQDDKYYIVESAGFRCIYLGEKK